MNEVISKHYHHEYKAMTPEIKVIISTTQTMQG